MPVNWSDVYENGDCPDCGDPIPAEAQDGDACQNCGHVFVATVQPDDEDPERWDGLA